jgi:hypothetical protein
MVHEVKIAVIYSGIQLPQTWSGPGLTVEPKEVTFQGDVVPNCICLRWMVSHSCRDGESLQDYINRVIPSGLDLLAYAISLVVPRPVDSVVSRTRVDGKVIKYEPVSRDMPSCLYVVAGAWKKRPGSLGYWSRLSPEGLRELAKLLGVLTGRLGEHDPNLFLPFRWYGKGTCETTGADRLLSFWIAFNALYADPKAETETMAIERYLGDVFDDAWAERLLARHRNQLEELSNMSLWVGHPGSRREISRELSALLRQLPDKAARTLQTAGLSVYALRNRLIHGTLDLWSGEVQDQLEIGETVLCGILREILWNRVTGEPMPTMKLVVSEGFGF